MDERVEVVCPDGSVLDVVPRSQMRRENLLHRSVYVAVVSGLAAKPKLVTHQRSGCKDINPSFWDISFGGVCDVAEDWGAAARRELAEEAGIVGCPLVSLGRSVYYSDSNAVLGQIYVAHYDGPVTFVDGEVERVESVPISELHGWLRRRAVCDDSMSMVLPKLVEHLKTVGCHEI